MSGVNGEKEHAGMFVCITAWLVGVWEGVIQQERHAERGRGEREEGREVLSERGVGG